MSGTHFSSPLLLLSYCQDNVGKSQSVPKKPHRPLYQRWLVRTDDTHLDSLRWGHALTSFDVSYIAIKGRKARYCRWSCSPADRYPRCNGKTEGGQLLGHVIVNLRSATRPQAIQLQHSQFALTEHPLPSTIWIGRPLSWLQSLLCCF